MVQPALHPHRIGTTYHQLPPCVNHLGLGQVVLLMAKGGLIPRLSNSHNQHLLLSEDIRDGRPWWRITYDEPQCHSLLDKE